MLRLDLRRSKLHLEVVEDVVLNKAFCLDFEASKCCFQQWELSRLQNVLCTSFRIGRAYREFHAQSVVRVSLQNGSVFFGGRFVYHLSESGPLEAQLKVIVQSVLLLQGFVSLTLHFKQPYASIYLVS